MKKPFRAQSTLEFIMIIILVLAGIVVMGPYVIRSVNAYLRSWEVSSVLARNKPDSIDPYTPGTEDPSCPSVPCNLFMNESACHDNSSGGRRCCIWVNGYGCSGSNGFGGDCKLVQPPNTLYPPDTTGKTKTYCEWRSIALHEDASGNSLCTGGYDPPKPSDPNELKNWKPKSCDNKAWCASHSCAAAGQFNCCNNAPDGVCTGPGYPNCPPGGETHTNCSADCWCGNNKCDWYESADPTSPDYCAADCAAAACSGNCLHSTYTNCVSEKQSDGKSCCVWVKKYRCNGDVYDNRCKKLNSGTCVTRLVANTNPLQCNNTCSWFAPFGPPANPYDSTCCNYCSCYNDDDKIWICSAAGCSAGPQE